MAKQARKLFAPIDEVIARPWQDPVRGLVALPNGYFAHTITDPPYSAHVHAKRWSRRKGTEGLSDPVNFDPLSDQELREVADEIYRTTRGWAVIFCSDDDVRAWRDAFANSGALRWVTCIWTKPNGTPQLRGEGPSQPCEHIVTTWCGEGRPSWNGGGKIGIYQIPTEPKKTRRHQTQKPKRLMMNLVLDFTLPGDLISDPYGGAGTTGMVARLTGRRFVMWERDATMALDAAKWIEPAREQLRLDMQFTARPAAFGGPKRAVGTGQEKFDGF